MSRPSAGRSARANQRQSRVETPAKAEESSILSIESGPPIETLVAAPDEPSPEPTIAAVLEPAVLEPAVLEPALLEPVAEPTTAAAPEPALLQPEEAEPEVEVQSPVNYDDEGIGEVEIDGSIYRFDSGKQGTALCLSARRDGAWRWSYLGELRWDGRDLRSKALDRSLLTQLSASLRTLAEQAI